MKMEYECECIDCGHKIQSDKHCMEILCEKCNGQMRRVNRPGIGDPTEKPIGRRP